MEPFALAWDAIREIRAAQAEHRRFTAHQADRLFRVATVLERRAGHEPRLAIVEDRVRKVEGTLAKLSTAQPDTLTLGANDILGYLPILSMLAKWAANVVTLAIVVWITMQYVPPEMRPALLKTIVGGATKGMPVQ